MENKWQTLLVVYDLVKDDRHPCNSNVRTNEIISRLHFPWDEIVAHLTELAGDGYITMKQFSTAVVSITDKGLQFVRTPLPI